MDLSKQQRPRSPQASYPPFVKPSPPGMRGRLVRTVSSSSLLAGLAKRISSKSPQYLPIPMVQEPKDIADESEWHKIEPCVPGGITNPFSYVMLKNLTGKVRIEKPAIGYGSFADVFMGIWVIGKKSTKVAVKELCLHIFCRDVTTSKMELRKEMRIWGELKHPNIVLLYGVIPRSGDRPSAMVCQWMKQGSLAKYLAEREDLDLHHRLKICVEIAHGLTYLHARKVIHGDLSPSNVLMDDDIAHLSDFGLANVVAELRGRSFSITKVSGAVRWVAPELLAYRDKMEMTSNLTTACDVYSFASVAFFVITGMVPYEKLNEANIVIEKLINTGCTKASSRPGRSLLTDEFWGILMMCWALDPVQRPDIGEVKRRLGLLYAPVCINYLGKHAYHLPADDSTLLHWDSNGWDEYEEVKGMFNSEARN